MVTVAGPQQGKKIVYATHGKIEAGVGKLCMSLKCTRNKNNMYNAFVHA